MISRLFIALYDHFHQHRAQLWGSLLAVVAVLVGLISRLDYVEDISDFMPFDAEYREAIQVYQEVAAGNRIVLFFSQQGDSIDQQHVIEAVDRYGELLAEADSTEIGVEWEPQIDYTQILDVFSFVYEHLPLYLTEADYARADSLWAADPEFVQHRLEQDYKLLTSSTGSFVQPMIQNDPLLIGSRLGNVLRQYQPELQFQQTDGYLFTPDGTRCLVNLTTPFGSSETDGNGRLCALLDGVRSQLLSEGDFADVEVSIIGSPVIAVSNARQIRHDSMLAVTLAVVLILGLLLYAFRSPFPLLHIGLSTAFGFLFGLGILSLFRDQVSVIVLGIASIILGIAVNYPLHYLCHLQHEPRRRHALRELITPLFIGNVTTVGAFLTLVPLDAVAVCDLGLFSAFMLIGTILFVLIFLPHLPGGVKSEALAALSDEETPEAPKPTRWNLLMAKAVQSRSTLIVLLLVTAVFGWFSLDTKFDSDLNHINYMTERERADMASLSALQNESQSHTVFVAVSGDQSEQTLQAMERLSDSIHATTADLAWRTLRNPIDLLPSQATQQRRLALWNDFWQRHGYGQGLTREFLQQAEKADLAPSAFEPFHEQLTTEAELLAWDDFEPLTTTVLTGLARQGQLVAQMGVAPDSVDFVEDRLRQFANVSQTSATAASAQAGSTASRAQYHVFDLASLNRRVSDALSDNFNYIGFACSCIVFLFLWLSFRRLELALIAFLPMVIGWLWILGLMELFDIQFNIVNVILATFIFGQGDDYTIFVTEGLVRDYREHRNVLVSYQRSILLSALIMLIGIGALILAKHPAMYSLAQVTIIGMSIVVFMAWIIPPVLFHWLTRRKGSFTRWLDR